MKTLRIFTTVLLLFFCGNLRAQITHFTTSGTIEFQKKVNMYALFRSSITPDNESFLKPAYEAYIKNHPQFQTLTSTLTFAGNKTLFTPADDENSTNGFWGNDAMVKQNNILFTDLATHSFIDQKKVFEKTFLLKDTSRHIQWKITDETRQIAGYECRRANALIMDSVYVVAFYTDRIPVSGGPESFTGLPGMILEVALPHEHVVWQATKVTDITVGDKALTPPKKGKPVNKKQLRTILNDAMKDWGNYAQASLKAFLL